jgi:hypothetical protein
MRFYLPIFNVKTFTERQPDIPGYRPYPKHIMPLRLFLWTPLVFLACGSLMSPTQAATVSGSASVWSYLRDDSVSHVQVVPILSLTLREFAGNAVRFETSLRGFSDVRHGQSNDEQVRVLRGVLIYAPAQSHWDVRLGQQWLTEGVGRGNVCGAWTRWRANANTSFTVYGGARLGSSLSLEEKNPDNGVAAGVHARTRISIVKAGASYYYLGKSGNTLFHGLGFEAEARPVSKLLTRGRLDLNLGQGSIEIAQLLADWNAHKNVQVTGEFRIHTPRVFDDSYFTKFLGEASTTYLRAGARWQFSGDYFVKGSGVTIFSDAPDPLYKVRASLGDENTEIGYTHWVTYSNGEMDGFYGQLRGDIIVNSHSVGELFGGFDFARGANGDVTLRPKTESQTMYVGVSLDLLSQLTLSATGEQIRDIDSEIDWRGLFSVFYRFSPARRGVQK